MTDDPALTALHADRHLPDGADVAAPLHVSTTYDRSGQDTQVYGRDHTRTRDRLEAVLGALEGGHAVTYSSGMAATAAVLDDLRPRRVTLPEDVYHGVRALVERGAARGDWEVGPDGDLIWLETPSNPKCLVADIAAEAEAAHARGALVVVDSTFATPVLQHPLALGADVVLHSTTKAISGHSDALGGVLVVGDEAVRDRLLAARRLTGGVPGSLDAWLTLRGVRTLPLRIERQAATARALAEWLVGRVERVWYPTLEGQPGAEVARRQMRAGGGVLSFELASFEEAAAVLDRMVLFRRATSLGGVESLVEHRRTVNPLAAEGLLRVSVGLEPVEALLEDLERALG